jgi:hypothetical protein
MKLLLIILLLSACGGFPVQVVQTTSPGGIPVTEHIDDHNLPKECGDHLTAAGCWTVGASGKNHIWLFTMSGTKGTRGHEYMHVDYKYWHGPWEIDATRTRRCAPVIANTDRYSIGQTVCVDQHGESAH